MVMSGGVYCVVVCVVMSGVVSDTVMSVVSYFDVCMNDGRWLCGQCDVCAYEV